VWPSSASRDQLGLLCVSPLTQIFLAGRPTFFSWTSPHPRSVGFLGWARISKPFRSEFIPFFLPGFDFLFEFNSRQTTFSEISPPRPHLRRFQVYPRQGPPPTKHGLLRFLCYASFSHIVHLRPFPFSPFLFLGVIVPMTLEECFSLFRGYFPPLTTGPHACCKRSNVAQNVCYIDLLIASNLVTPEFPSEDRCSRDYSQPQNNEGFFFPLYLLSLFISFPSLVLSLQ